MKGAILSSILSASAVAAQISLAPELFNAAAVNINDPEYTTCSVVAEYVGECVTALGGTDALATADPTAVLSCACCVSATPVYPLYSACSSYLSDEGGATYSDSYSAYSVLYSACDAAGLCTEGSDSTFETSTSTSESESETETESDFATITSSAEQTYATACEDMIAVYTSCSNKIDNFSDLPFKSQALCYCCRTRDGTLSWTDVLDKYAKTCASWARTGEPETAYSVAQTFASFCDRFSDVCDSGTVTADSESTITDSSAEATDDSTQASNPNTEPVTVTIQPTETSASGDSDGAAGSLRVGVCGTLLAAVLAMAMVL